MSFKKKVAEKLNTSLAKCLVLMCKVMHLNFRTKSFLLGQIKYQATIINTKPQSLFKSLSIKERLKYQHRNMETKYVAPSLKESPIYIYIYIYICVQLFVSVICSRASMRLYTYTYMCITCIYNCASMYICICTSMHICASV